mgnify:FL=1
MEKRLITKSPSAPIATCRTQTIFERKPTDMPEEIVMPRLSDTMQEGTIARWAKSEGDLVKSGDVLMEVETDKATLELTSYHDGTIAQIVIANGGTAPVGTVVGIIALPKSEEHTSELQSH